MKESTLHRFTESLGILSSGIEKENRYVFDGITGRQLMVLAGIATMETPATLGDVAHRCGGSYQSMKHIITHLDDLGLVESQRDEGDRRKYLITTTEEGAALADKTVRYLGESEHRFAQHLTEEELEAFIKVVYTIHECGGYLGGFRA